MHGAKMADAALGANYLQRGCLQRPGVASGIPSPKLPAHARALTGRCCISWMAAPHSPQVLGGLVELQQMSLSVLSRAVQQRCAELRKLLESWCGVVPNLLLPGLSCSVGLERCSSLLCLSQALVRSRLRVCETGCVRLALFPSWAVD